MKDFQFYNFEYTGFEIDHSYGENVHLVSKPYILSLLAKLGHKDTKHPMIMHLINQIYDGIFHDLVNKIMPRVDAEIDTRMVDVDKDRGVYRGPIIGSQTPVVCVDLARAGTIPSQIFFEKFNYFIDPDLVRQDHFYVNRVTNEKGEVTGVNVSGSKIGGPIEDAFVFFPDPMGATGSTIVRAYNHYKNKVEGTAKKFIAVHMIITPEYIEKVTKECPDLVVFAVRLDRGLSSDEALSAKPGSVKGERGLTDNDYIMPGAGGIGEILNNAFV
jgi:uracil phosphoribosyltransferase